MFSTLRTRFGIPGVISVMALVFAMFGGAYAASNSSDGGKATASAKAKKGPRGPKGAKGDTGPAGPAGPQGPAGPGGPKGDAGANGSTGTNGTSAAVTSFAGSKGTCTKGQGGLEVSSASPTAYVCNGEKGKEGDPWTAGGTLPSGATETGIFGGGEGQPAGKYFYPASFNVPLQERGEFGHTVLVKSNETSATGCPGRGDGGVPEAEPGYFCVYVGPETGGAVERITSYILNESAEPPQWEWAPIAGATGATIWVECPGPDPCFIGGTWAVTAE